MKDKLILKDQTRIEIEPGASLSAIKIISSSKAEMVEKWKLLTKENLSHIEIRSGNDALLAEYDDLVLISETSTILANGSISTIFYFREKTEMEKIREEIAALKEMQGVQDGAIADLGAAVSEMVTGGEA